ncbi:hypothetical protein glysoja_009955 [Glycine soja]|nr:hypothetical protein glysoja_009955 [Glycine soja]
MLKKETMTEEQIPNIQMLLSSLINSLQLLRSRKTLAFRNRKKMAYMVLSKLGLPQWFGCKEVSCMYVC